MTHRYGKYQKLIPGFGVIHGNRLTWICRSLICRYFLAGNLCWPADHPHSWRALLLVHMMCQVQRQRPVNVFHWTCVKNFIKKACPTCPITITISEAMIDGILLLYYFICIKQKAHPTCPTTRTIFEAMMLCPRPIGSKLLKDRAEMKRDLASAYVLCLRTLVVPNLRRDKGRS